MRTLIPMKHLKMKIVFYLLLLYIRNACAIKVYPWDTVKEVKKVVCKSKECEKIGEMYTKHLDSEKNPCSDFYEYACGNWEIKNPMPPDADEWSSRVIQQDRIIHDLKRILEKEAKHSKLGWTYKACTRIPAIGQLNFDNLMKYVDKIDVWPTLETKESPPRHPWWAIDSYYVSQTGESAFFDILTAYNSEEHNLPLFHLRAISSPYGRFIHIGKWETAQMQTYEKFLTAIINVCSKIKKTDKIKVHKKDIPALIAFRLELRHIAMEASKDNNQNMLISINHLQKTFAKEHVKSKTKLIDWLTVMRSIYENNSPESININTKVNVHTSGLEYFESLAKLLDKTPEDILVNHIHLYFLERHMHLHSSWRNKLIKIIYSDPPCIVKMGYIRRIHERWENCLVNLHKTHEFEKLFVKKFLDPGVKQVTENIVSESKYVLEYEISDSNWLDSDTKDKSVTKVKNMQAWIGYPIWYDVPKLREKYNTLQLTPMEVNTYNLYEHNTIFLPTGVLFPPMGFISDSFPVTYATVGFSVAHESYHAFNAEGITYDAKGKSCKTWWSDSMLKTYETQKQCFINQYKQFLIKGLNVKDPKQCDVEKAYDESMADTMGLKLAYQLYKKSLFVRHGKCYIPPHLKHFTCDQLFFLAFANTQCSSVTSNIVDYGTMDHGSPRYRVNGPLMNMEEFSKAFNCKRNDVMQLPPASQCDLWTKI